MKWTPHASGTELSWVETGGPGIQGSPEKGFGMRLVEDILSAEIGGVSVDFLPAGLRCQIQIRHEAR
jgi:two-component sensor histidine kinase